MKSKDSSELSPEIEKYYGEFFSSRWPELLKALKEDVEKIPLKNPFEMGDPYSIDAASIEVAQAVDMQAGMTFLDTCAAPGGKSLAIIFSVKGEGQFFLNDLSAERCRRLNRILKERLPETIQKNVRVFQKDASRWALKNKNQYDRVLVDAPCSGERHLIEHPEEWRGWSVKKSKRMAIRQYALLAAGFDSLAPGGRLVYSTCSLSPFENEEVVEKLLDRKEGSVEVLQKGIRILPSEELRSGPMFYATFLKSSE